MLVILYINLDKIKLHRQIHKNIRSAKDSKH